MLDLGQMVRFWLDKWMEVGKPDHRLPIILFLACNKEAAMKNPSRIQRTMEPGQWLC